MHDLLRKRDFWSGILMTATGAAFLIMSLTYPFGTARNIGAGTFPAMVAGLLVLVGIGVAIRAIRDTDAMRLHPAPLRPLMLVLAAIAAFAALLPTAGFVVATVALVLLCARAHPGFNWPGALALSAVVVIFGAAVFIYGLGLPIPLGPARLF